MFSRFFKLTCNYDNIFNNFFNQIIKFYIWFNEHLCFTDKR